MSRFTNKMDEVVIIHYMKKNPDKFFPRALDAFTVMGLESFANEYVATMEILPNGK
jgi:hypothetical protein